MDTTDFVNQINKTSQSTGVSAYVLAASAAVQQGLARLENPTYDYYGNLSGGTLHFPGEENFQYQAGRKFVNGSEGLGIGRDNIATQIGRAHV